MARFHDTQLGRGETAVRDMRARIDAAKESGRGMSSLIDELWDRHHKAVVGPGHTYDKVEKS